MPIKKRFKNVLNSDIRNIAVIFIKIQVAVKHMEGNVQLSE